MIYWQKVVDEQLKNGIERPDSIIEELYNWANDMCNAIEDQDYPKMIMLKHKWQYGKFDPNV